MSLPALTLSYTATGDLQVSVSGGATVSAGSPQLQIPFGDYQVVVIDNASDTTDPAHMFQLTGPGVTLGTDLQQGDDKSEIYTETLAANATYTFSDSAHPGTAVIVFRTNGTPASSASAPTVSVPATTANGSSKSTNSSTVGSKVAKPLPLRGSLGAQVSAAGRPTLTRNGKAVTTLQAGRYTLTVVDRSGHAGFAVTKADTRPLVLTTAPFEGRRTTTVALAKGQWSYTAIGTARPTYFVVVG